jgi:hypothetical protein
MYTASFFFWILILCFCFVAIHLQEEALWAKLDGDALFAQSAAVERLERDVHRHEVAVAVL